jgi:5,10-methylenetetrahydrofolate reductase
MSRLREQFESGRRTLWLEVSPPRGVDMQPLLRQLEMLRGHVDAINLTDNALGRVRMTPLVFGAAIKQRLGLPVVLNFSCRDRNLLALRADLLGVAAIGTEGIVALRGDQLDPAGPAHSVYDVDTIGLLHLIGELNGGELGGDRLLAKRPDLIAGAVANPYRVNLEREEELLARKAAAGARFVVTQPVFDPDPAMRIITIAQRVGIKLIAGILPVKSARMAHYLKVHVKDLKSQHRHFDRYQHMTDTQAQQFSLSRCLELMNALAPYVAGFNIMSGGEPSLAIELALAYALREQPASCPL